MNKWDEAYAANVALLLKKPDAGRLLEPLEFLLDEHMRQRALCELFKAFAASETIGPDAAGAAVEFMRCDFRLHVRDEEEDLFPLLRRRVSEDERFMDVLDDLTLEHTSLRETVKRLIEELAEASLSEDEVTSTPELTELLHAFSASERRHLVVENAIVIPMARASLTTTDISALGKRMAARRGITMGKSDNAG